MMFILNFDYVVDEESDNSTEKISPTSPTKSDQSEYLIPFSPYYDIKVPQKAFCLFSFLSWYSVKISFSSFS